MKQIPLPPSGVLFDLDGTLLDSAPGLYAALKTTCAKAGVAAPPFAEVREMVSRGASAVLGTAWSDAAELERHRARFLEAYADVMADLSHPFDGVEPLLAALEAQGTPWGVVTNKAGFLARPLLDKLGWLSRAAAVVAGDTLPQSKPDPAPVLHACALAGIEPALGLFVGDDPRDVQAGHGAGMTTVAVSWGYLAGGNPADWGADVLLHEPRELADLLGLDVAA